MSPKDNFWSYLNHLCEIVVIWNNQMIANMDPWVSFDKYKHTVSFSCHILKMVRPGQVLLDINTKIWTGVLRYGCLQYYYIKAKPFLVVFCFVEPGEFSFEQACYFANVVSGDVTCSIIRKKGCDGTVTLTYNTMWVWVYFLLFK